MTDKQEPPKKPGKIDLIRLFEAEAINLQASVKMGQILHGTRNIRDSGATLEVRLRDFFATRLPHPFKVIQGYLFDLHSKCTPQIDALIVNDNDSHQLMTSVEGATYVPFTSALVFFEIKNSAYKVATQLDQIGHIASTIDQMTQDLRQNRSAPGPIIWRPMSIMFFATSDKRTIEQVGSWYQNNLPKVPTYTVLLDRGLIVARSSHQEGLFEFDEPETLNPYITQHYGVPCVFAPMSDQMIMGRTLLWLYFAIAAHTNLTEGNSRPINDFARATLDAHPLERISRLDSVAGWDQLAKDIAEKRQTATLAEQKRKSV